MGNKVVFAQVLCPRLIRQGRLRVNWQLEDKAMIVLTIEHLKKTYGAELILEDVHFELRSGERTGLVGRNGAGKTTVFKVICGYEAPTEGLIHKAKGVQIGYLEQIPDYPEHVNVENVLMQAFGEVLNIQKEMRTLEHQMGSVSGDQLDQVMHAYDLAQKTYEIKGGYEVTEKLGRIVTGLKLDSLLTQSFETLSGGEKTRTLLAKLLLESPDVLLLDEPTNHLDVESVEWLEDFLREYTGAVVIVSHDRYFLDRTVERIVEIEMKKSRIWHGNYTAFMEQKDEWLRQQLKAYVNQQRKIRAMEEAAARFRQWGTNADNEAMFVKAKNMEKRIERMDKIEKPFEDQSNIKMAFQSSGRSGKEVLLLDDLSAGYEAVALFKSVNLDLRYKDRVALVGKNGTGKSTLLNVILGKLKPMTGSVKLGANVKIGFLEQDIIFEHAQRSVLAFFNHETGLSEGVCRNKLARFLFMGEDVFKSVEALSGGEKVRLKLALMMEEGINFLIMDEPTNHVDISSREMIELAVEHFEGTVLFISHDRYLINKVASRIADLTPNGIEVYECSYDAFRKEKARREERNETAENVKKEKNYRDADERRRQNAQRKKAKRISEIEYELAEREVAISDLQAELDSSTLPYESLVKRYDKMTELKEVYDQLMEEWVMLQE